MLCHNSYCFGDLISLRMINLRLYQEFLDLTLVHFDSNCDTVELITLFAFPHTILLRSKYLVSLVNMTGIQPSHCSTIIFAPVVQPYDPQFVRR